MIAAGYGVAAIQVQPAIQLHLLDFAVFFLYLVGISVFGSSFFRTNRTVSAFTLGNRAIPAWVVTLSIFATFVSSISYLALPGSAYLSDWNAFVFSLSIPLAAIVAIRIFVPLYRKVNSPSAYTYLEQRFGPWARIYASASYFLTQLMRIGTILYLLALAIHSIFRWEMALVILITGVTVMIYSILGGIRAVVWTDAIQAIILMAGGLVSALYLLFAMPNGPAQLFEIAAAQDKFSLGSFGPDLSSSTFWVVLIYGIFINLQNYGIDQNYVQRYLASGSDSRAKRSALSGGLLYLPVSAMFLFIGTALYAYYQSSAGCLPPALQDPARSDAVFPYFIVNELPAGVTGLLIASVFAAGMSTISTSYNSTATVILTDYYQRFFRGPAAKRAENGSLPGPVAGRSAPDRATGSAPDRATGRSAPDRDAMRVLYVSTLVVGTGGILIAMAMINVKSALDAWWKLASVFSGGMLGLFLLGLLGRRRNVTGAVAGVTAGLGIILWMSLSDLLLSGDATGNRFHTYLSIVFGTSAILLVGFLFPLIARKFRRPE